MKEIEESNARKEFSEIINQVTYNKERITVYRHGKKVAAVVPYEDLLLLEKMEEETDLRAARQAMKEKGDNIPWEDVKKELNIDQP